MRPRRTRLGWHKRLAMTDPSFPASMRPRRTRLGWLHHWALKRDIVPASMRPRRTRLGWYEPIRICLARGHRFNEAEAHAPRMAAPSDDKSTWAKELQ